MFISAYFVIIVWSLRWVTNPDRYFHFWWILLCCCFQQNRPDDLGLNQKRNSWLVVWHFIFMTTLMEMNNFLLAYTCISACVSRTVYKLTSSWRKSICLRAVSRMLSNKNDYFCCCVFSYIAIQLFDLL